MDLRWPVMCNGWFGQGLSWSSSLLAGLGLRLGLLLCFLTLWTFHCLAAVGLHFLAREQHDAVAESPWLPRPIPHAIVLPGREFRIRIPFLVDLQTSDRERVAVERVSGDDHKVAGKIDG